MRKIFIKGRPKAQEAEPSLTRDDIAEIEEMSRAGRRDAPVMAGVDIAVGADYPSYGMLTPDQSRAFAQRVVDAPSLADIFERAAERRRRQDGTAINLVLGSIQYMRSMERITETLLLEYTKNGAALNCSVVVDSMRVAGSRDPGETIEYVVEELTSLVLADMREDIGRAIAAAVSRSPLGRRR